MQTQKTAVNAASSDLSSKESWKPCPDSHPYKTMPTCQRQQCDITTTQPQESSPEHPPPSTASLAGRNGQDALPAHTAPAAGSQLPPRTPCWGCSCTAIAATGNTRHGCCWASTVHSVHTDLLNASGLNEIICCNARVRYRRPSVPCSAIHSRGHLFIFLRLSWSSLRWLPGSLTHVLGTRGRWLPFRERGSQSVHICSDTAG